MSVFVCAALTWKRMVSSPRGTTGKVKPDHQDTLVKKVLNEAMRFGGVPDQQRNDGMGPWDGFQTKSGDPLAELLDSLSKVFQSLETFGAVADVDGFDRGGTVPNAERVGVDVGVRFLAYGLNQRFTCCDKAAVHPKGFAECPDDHVRLSP